MPAAPHATLLLTDFLEAVDSQSSRRSLCLKWQLRSNVTCTGAHSQSANGREPWSSWPWHWLNLEGDALAKEGSYKSQMFERMGKWVFSRSWLQGPYMTLQWIPRTTFDWEEELIFRKWVVVKERGIPCETPTAALESAPAGAGLAQQTAVLQEE